MNWQERMNRALTMMEEHLQTKLDWTAVASAAGCSTFHFFRMFEVITGYGPGEYLRRRRLSSAALELAGQSVKVIDVALRYGYETPDAFSRAFKKEFGYLPSEAKGQVLQAFLPLSFTISLKGAYAMEYRIEQHPALKLVGFGFQSSGQDGQNFREIPAFYNQLMADGRYQTLCDAKKPTDAYGLYAVIHSHHMTTGLFRYTVAIHDDHIADLPGVGFERVQLPALTWAQFRCPGPFVVEQFQNLIQRIYGEWFPSSGYEHAGYGELEVYSNRDMTAADYYCEYWVPIQKVQA